MADTEGVPPSLPTAVPRAMALVGPTASGKSALSLPLAEALDAEIISMDSRQVYRGMDVGTAKVSAEERARVPHHGLDLIDPGERYSAGRFATDARRWITAIRDRGKVPLLVGGTGFFLSALMQPLFDEPPADETRRDRLREYLARQPRAELERWVAALDPDRAAVASEGGPQRLGRTLEVALLTGRPLSWWHRERAAGQDPVPVLIAVLELPDEELDRRIAERVRRMMRKGLVAEVAGLAARGIGRDAPGMSGVGYREVLDALEGRCSIEEASASIEVATRRYARRQRSWFRNQIPSDGVLRLNALDPHDRLVSRIVAAWTGAVTGTPRRTHRGSP